MSMFQVGGQRWFWGLLVVLLAAATLASGGSVEPPEGMAAWLDEGFALMHQGRLADAEATFSAASHAFPADPAPHYYRALAIFWQAIHAPDRGALEPRFEAAANRAIDLGKDHPDPAARLVAGSAYLLRAQARARQKQSLKAGFDAKKGKKALESVLRQSPGHIDAYFGLGAYNYYAAHVNALIKGLRFLLFIPGGNAPLGLQQLQEAADHGSRTRLEAHLLLSVILADGREAAYEQALEHLRQAAALAPDSPSVTLELAKLLDGTGLEAEAMSVLGEFLGRSSEAPAFDYAAELRCQAAVHLARIHLRQARPLAAAAVLEEVLANSLDEGPEAARARSLSIELDWDLGFAGRGRQRAAGWQLSWPPLPAGEGCAAGQLSDLVALQPDSATQWRQHSERLRRLAEVTLCTDAGGQRRRFTLASALLWAGEAEAAAPLFAALLEESDLNPELRGWSALLLGRHEAAAARPEVANQLFKEAAGLRGFADRLRGEFYLARPAARPWTAAP